MPNTRSDSIGKKGGDFMTKAEYKKYEKEYRETQKLMTAAGRMPLAGFVTLVTLYLLSNVITTMVAQSQAILTVAGMEVPLSSLTGTIASLANVSVIMLVVLYKKPGFLISLLLLITQFPVILVKVIRNHALAGIPGLFTNILTLTAIIMIRWSAKKAERNHQIMRQQAVTDLLTGLPNRFAVSELVSKLLKRETEFAVVSIDLNNFKSINETMGHETGNRVLAEVAKLWKDVAQSRENGTIDVVARQGGDEFSLIIRRFGSDTDIMNTIRRYEAALENGVTVDDCDFFITASIGYALYPQDGKNSDALFSCADTAMAEVKRRNNGDRILRYAEDQMPREHTLNTERLIRSALESDRLTYHLQPQYDLSHRLRGFEALARMQDANGTALYPSEFIPAAEKAGLIDRVDLRVFRSAALFFGDLIRKTGADITLSVNISVRHLMKNGFLDEVRHILEESGVPADQVELEITESIMIDSVDQALQCINEIKKMGMKIAIDDFGTGYSSLSYLNRFPADLLKIDKSFIDKMNSGESSKQYVAAIISMGHIMHFSVIAEGVEESAQLETLKAIGCDYIQGYLWGKPLTPEEAEALVRMPAEVESRK